MGKHKNQILFWTLVIGGSVFWIAVGDEGKVSAEAMRRQWELERARIELNRTQSMLESSGPADWQSRVYNWDEENRGFLERHGQLARELDELAPLESSYVFPWEETKPSDDEVLGRQPSDEEQELLGLDSEIRAVHENLLDISDGPGDWQARVEAWSLGEGADMLKRSEELGRIVARQRRFDPIVLDPLPEDATDEELRAAELEERLLADELRVAVESDGKTVGEWQRAVESLERETKDQRDELAGLFKVVRREKLGRKVKRLRDFIDVRESEQNNETETEK